MKTINYISEINLPSSSGYAHHVLKICDAFSKYGRTKLFVFSKSISFSNLKSQYLLKKNFQIEKFSKKKNFNFLDRVFYSFFIFKNVERNSIIISRSLISSMVLSIFKIKNIIELHHPPTGFTYFLFFIFRYLKLDKNLDYIFLHKNLKKELKIKTGLILDDAVDIEDFKKIKNKKDLKFCYVGSLFKGKGIETIIKIAKKFPKEKFHVYGDKKTLLNLKYKDKVFFKKNILLHNFVKYCEIPSILMSSQYLLLPYSNQVSVNSKSLEVSNYMSPLKMFDYLAAGGVILASNLKVYSHILKNNFNCLLTKKNNEKDWVELIKKVLTQKKTLKKLRENAILTAKKNTWDIRVKKILKFQKNIKNVKQYSISGI